MVRRIASRFMMVFVMAVLMVGFAQVLTPTPLQAHVCEHQGAPPCWPIEMKIKYCSEWEGHCCICSMCWDPTTGFMQEVCWVD